MVPTSDVSKVRSGLQMHDNLPLADRWQAYYEVFICLRGLCRFSCNRYSRAHNTVLYIMLKTILHILRHARARHTSENSIANRVTDSRDNNKEVPNFN